MKFKLEINCDNAAFEDSGLRDETARMLRAAADNLECVSVGIKHFLHDINGNTTGEYQFTNGRK